MSENIPRPCCPLSWESTSKFLEWTAIGPSQRHPQRFLYHKMKLFYTPNILNPFTKAKYMLQPGLFKLIQMYLVFIFLGSIVLYKVTFTIIKIRLDEVILHSQYFKHFYRNRVPELSMACKFLLKYVTCSLHEPQRDVIIMFLNNC